MLLGTPSCILWYSLLWYFLAVYGREFGTIKIINHYLDWNRPRTGLTNGKVVLYADRSLIRLVSKKKNEKFTRTESPKRSRKICKSACFYIYGFCFGSDFLYKWTLRYSGLSFNSCCPIRNEYFILLCGSSSWPQSIWLATWYKWLLKKFVKDNYSYC